MNSHFVSDAVTRMTWIDKVVSPIQKGVAWTYGKLGRNVEDVVHGDFIGHPLHPALVHLPLGCFTLAAITDIFSVSPAAANTSYVAILVGVISMIPAAIAGVTDWHPYAEDSVRRIGGLHMLLNLLAFLVYIVSLADRAAGGWGFGIFFGYIGFAIIACSGFLGGILVYEKRIGTDHAPQPEDEAAPEEYVPVMGEWDLDEGKLVKARVQDVPIVLMKVDGEVFAMADVCAHEGGSLSEGTIENGCLVCPLHQSAFSLLDGSVVVGPSVYPQPYFPTRIQNGFIEVLAVRQLEPMPQPTPRGRASMR